VHTVARDSRAALLDAATDAVRHGADWDRLRMVDVARAAGVSRQTLYYEFGSRDALGQAVALREGERHADAALHRSRLAAVGGASPGAAVAAAVALTLSAAGADPLLKAVLTDDAGGLLPYLTTRSEALLSAVGDRLSALLGEQWPQLDPVRVRLVVDLVDRLTLSHLVSPAGAAEQVAAEIALVVDAVLTPVPAHPSAPPHGGPP